MQNNIIDILGFKDRDICAKVTKASPSRIDITISKVCKPLFCPVCGNFETEQFSFVDRYKHSITCDLVADRKKTTTELYFQSIPLKELARAKHLITDMYRPFEKYVSSYFPNAIHIVDSFHVMQLIIRHILGCIRRRKRGIDEWDRARHEKIEQDIHRRFEFHHSRE